MNAFIFPGQGCQKQGMGRDLYNVSKSARDIFELANDILGERFSDYMFTASEEELMDTRYTQLAIFIYEIAIAKGQKYVEPDCVAGHSLGEYAALVVSGSLDFEEALKFIKIRGQVFYDAFQRHPSAMGAIIGLNDDKVQKVLNDIKNEDGEDVYIANYNGPGQLVITGGRSVVKKACRIFKEIGAKKALILPQKGVGHSPNSAEEGSILERHLKMLNFKEPTIPIFQDADGLPHRNPQEIFENQVKLMTHPVLWTKITNEMVKAGVRSFYECGTDDTLGKIINRMYPELHQQSILDVPTYFNKVRNFKILNK